MIKAILVNFKVSFGLDLLQEGLSDIVDVSSPVGTIHEASGVVCNSWAKTVQEITFSLPNTVISFLNNNQSLVQSVYLGRNM